MKIAVVSPSPVPFTIGGAENLAWGLCDSINKFTSHQAELIKLPMKERSFWELIDTYYSFYKLDLSHFDMVISTKYPSWMVKNDNCTVYMLHTLRGLYDTYHLCCGTNDVPEGCAPVDALLEYMDSHRDYESLDLFFEYLYALRNDEQVPQEFFAFPAPFIRRVIHYLDYCGLSQPGMRKWCAISNIVKNRTDYFPSKSKVRTVYPPTVLKGNQVGEGTHLFMCSRLDAPKRIDMLIAAMKQVKSDVQLYIAGTGPDRERLEGLAQNDDRIHFLGFVSDEEVENYYANAICVPYFPYDEDYGYITIEAMMHKKPVITTTDAGGPTEFVIEGETGYIVEFDASMIAEKIDYLVQNKDKAREMGEQAYENVKDISWENAVHDLLEEEPMEQIKRKKLVVTSTFSIYPPMGGGQARIFNLYKQIATQYDVDVIAYTAAGTQHEVREVAPGLTEHIVPKSSEHQQKESEIEQKVLFPITDIVMPLVGELTPKFGEILESASKDATAIVLSHPYTYIQYINHGNNKPFIYEAHNVEYIMKKGMLPKNEESERLIENLFDVEKHCCQDSEFILTCSEEDKETIIKLYDVPASKIIVVPNGVDVEATTFTSVEQRIKNKKENGIDDEKIGLFLGSWHGPNLEAAEVVIKVAEKCPDTRLLLMGSQCGYFQSRNLPQNMGLLGMVSEQEKNRVFSMIDFALNPMMSGSGTNLKMFDYMSAGIPVITSEFGTRGIENKDCLIVADNEELDKAINEFNLAEQNELTENARKCVEQVFDWKVIAKIYLDRLENL